MVSCDGVSIASAEVPDSSIRWEFSYESGRLSRWVQSIEGEELIADFEWGEDEVTVHHTRSSIYGEPCVEDTIRFGLQDMLPVELVPAHSCGAPVHRITFGFEDNDYAKLSRVEYRSYETDELLLTHDIVRDDEGRMTAVLYEGVESGSVTVGNCCRFPCRTPNQFLPEAYTIGYLE